MSWLKRIENVIVAVLMLLCAGVMCIAGSDGIKIIICILCLALIFGGISKLWYYFRMARYMIGGKIILYLGLIYLDFGFFAAGLTATPKAYIIIYLVICSLISGGIDILRANEQRKATGDSWKVKLLGGICNILIAIICIVYFRHTDVVVYVYAIGLAISAVTRILTSFKKTAIVYIQ